MAGAGWAGQSLLCILLTELDHVNRSEAEISPRRIENDAVGTFLSSAVASELTVPHKTVAEPR
jgi:hypothetical protein